MAIIILGIAVAVRRLHDMGKSGWVFLINGILIIGSMWFLVLMLKRSIEGEKQYGANTEENTETKKIKALFIKNTWVGIISILLLVRVFYFVSYWTPDPEPDDIVDILGNTEVYGGNSAFGNYRGKTSMQKNGKSVTVKYSFFDKDAEESGSISDFKISKVINNKPALQGIWSLKDSKCFIYFNDNWEYTTGNQLCFELNNTQFSYSYSLSLAEYQIDEIIKILYTPEEIKKINIRRESRLDFDTLKLTSNGLLSYIVNSNWHANNISFEYNKRNNTLVLKYYTFGVNNEMAPDTLTFTDLVYENDFMRIYPYSNLGNVNWGFHSGSYDESKAILISNDAKKLYIPFLRDREDLNNGWLQNNGNKDIKKQVTISQKSK